MYVGFNPNVETPYNVDFNNLKAPEGNRLFGLEGFLKGLVGDYEELTPTHNFKPNLISNEKKTNESEQTNSDKKD